MLDNTALTIILVALNVVWFFLLTAATIYNIILYTEAKKLRKEQKALAEMLLEMPPPDPKTGLRYQHNETDRMNAEVNDWLNRSN